VALVNTVEHNKSSYNNHDYCKAVLARKIQRLNGRLSTRQYQSIIDNNMLPNCPIDCCNIKAAKDILGPNRGSLKGKTVRRPVPHIKTKLIDIPLKIMQLYHDVTIACDIMFVN
jgi:hypothetical protein